TPPPRRPGPRPVPLAFLASCPPQLFGGTPAHVQRQCPLRRVQRRTAALGPSRLSLWKSGGVRCGSRRSGQPSQAPPLSALCPAFQITPCGCPRAPPLPPPAAPQAQEKGGHEDHHSDDDCLDERE